MLGLLNLASLIVLNDYVSFFIWGICFGICWALPVSSQFSAISEFTSAQNTTEIISFIAASLFVGLFVMPGKNL